MKRFSDDTYRDLIQAGWFDGRDVLDQVCLLEGVALFPAAKNVLREFGNLHIGAVRPGKECSTSDIRIDPLVGKGYEEDFAEYGAELGVKLYPLGEALHGNFVILLDEQGRVFVWIMFDILSSCAKSFDQALEVMLQGLKYEEF